MMTNLRILIVDDYDFHLQTLVEICNNQCAPCEARGESDASQVLQIAFAWEPHLIIYDGLMEDMRAWQFGYAYLRSEPPHRPYMVALTGFGSTLHRRLCEENGFDEYVTKPIEMSQLKEWVNKTRKRFDEIQKERA